MSLEASSLVRIGPCPDCGRELVILRNNLDRLDRAVRRNWPDEQEFMLDIDAMPAIDWTVKASSTDIALAVISAFTPGRPTE